MKIVNWLVLAGAVLRFPDGILAQDTPDILEFHNGQITWTNVDPTLYYSIEWLPRLTATNWSGSFQSLQDLQSSETTLAVDVPVFFRIVGNTNAVYKLVLDHATPEVLAGYYEATNLVQVDPDITPGNIAQDVTVFGVTGTAVVATGDAVETQVLAGATFSKAGASGLSGTMPDLGAVTLTPGAGQQAIQQGYHDGSGFVSGDSNLVTENIRADISIFGVAGKPEVVDTTTGDAVAGDLLAGKKVWVDGTEVTGSVETRILSPDAMVVPDGYYAATNLAEVETELVPASIRAEVTLFGVTGKLEVVDTTSGDAVPEDLVEGKSAWVDGAEVIGNRTPGPVAKTGQTNSFRTGDDGDFEAGTAWPTPRFTQVDTDVVRDNLTSLVWAADANLDGTKDWPGAVDYCANLDLGGFSDWRLPNVRELQSLIDFGRYNPALPQGHPFSGLQADDYWTSTMLADPSGDAWFLRLTDGYIDVSGTSAALYVWPVRGGQ